MSRLLSLAWDLIDFVAPILFPTPPPYVAWAIFSIAVGTILCVVIWSKSEAPSTTMAAPPPQNHSDPLHHVTSVRQIVSQQIEQGKQLKLSNANKQFALHWRDQTAMHLRDHLGHDSEREFLAKCKNGLALPAAIIYDKPGDSSSTQSWRGVIGEGVIYLQDIYENIGPEDLIG